MSSLRRPDTSEFAPYYGKYIGLVPDGDLLALLDKQFKDLDAMLKGVTEEKSTFRYAPGKWSIREVIGHVSDAERVFTYRALRAARRDATELPGFDEGPWAEASNAHQRPLKALLDDHRLLRAATISLFRGFDDNAWTSTVVASKNPVSARALAYIVAGHEAHHANILRERYLNS